MQTYDKSPSPRAEVSLPYRLSSLTNPAIPPQLSPAISGQSFTSGDKATPRPQQQEFAEPSPPTVPILMDQLQPFQDEIPPRTPSPSPGPPPVFRVMEEHVRELTQQLVDTTSALNVEQLEQLRALCLGCVWRRKSEWVRDKMVHELLEIVGRFVEEVSLVEDLAQDTD